MNTDQRTTDTSTAPVSTSSTARRSNRRRRSHLAALAVAVVASATLGLVAKPQTTEAASGVTACFKTRTGLVVGPVTTYLELYTTSGWTAVAAKSNSGFTGCVTYSMSGSYRNYYSRIRMAGRASTGDYFYATPALIALPGDLFADLGKTNVSCIGFCYGV